LKQITDIVSDEAFVALGATLCADFITVRYCGGGNAGFVDKVVAVVFLTLFTHTELVVLASCDGRVARNDRHGHTSQSSCIELLVLDTIVASKPIGVAAA